MYVCIFLRILQKAERFFLLLVKTSCVDHVVHDTKAHHRSGVFCVHPPRSNLILYSPFYLVIDQRSVFFFFATIRNRSVGERK